VSAPAENLFSILTFRGGYNTNLVLAGTSLLGFASGWVGSFALLRRRALLADAMSHATLPGIALAFLLGHALGAGRSLPLLFAGAAIGALLGAAAVPALSRWTRLRDDAAIAIVLSVFFGTGVVLLSIIQSLGVGGQGGLKTLIYGQTAAILARDVTAIGVLALAATAIIVLFYRPLLLVAFDEGFARVEGWPVGRMDLIILALLVLVTVAGLPAVGLILVVAMLIIPAASARFWSDRLTRVLPLAGCFGALAAFAGTAISALSPRTPAGAIIVLTAGAIFLVSLLASPRRGVVALGWRRASMRLRLAREHLVESLVQSPRRPVAEIASDRGWSSTAVALCIASARAHGWVRGGRDALVLTERGRSEGARIARNHRLWSAYLIRHADVAPSHVDWSVDRVEHVLGEEVVRDLERELTAEARA